MVSGRIVRTAISAGRVAVLGWIALFTVAWTVGCKGPTDDSAAIRQLIAEAADLAEKHQIGDLMRLTSETFTATPGGHDTNGVKKILFVAFRRYGNFSVLFPRPVVDIGQDASRATATVYFVIISKDRSLPGLKDLYNDPLGWLDEARDKADPYRLTLDLVKKDRRWQVQKAHLEGAVGMLMGGGGETVQRLSPTTVKEDKLVKRRFSDGFVKERGV